MNGTGYAEITIREMNGEKRESRKLKKKTDFIEMINKYGEVIINLTWEEMLEFWDVPVTEVEEYAKRKRLKQKIDRTRSTIK